MLRDTICGGKNSIFYWRRVDLQCYVSFWCTAKWFSYTYISAHLCFLLPGAWKKLIFIVLKYIYILLYVLNIYISREGQKMLSPLSFQRPFLEIVHTSLFYLTGWNLVTWPHFVERERGRGREKGNSWNSRSYLGLWGDLKDGKIQGL